MLENIGIANSILNLLKSIYQLLPIKPKVRIQITRITYQSIKNDSAGPVMFISAYPNRYNLEANVLYLRGKKNTISNAFLTIHSQLKLQPKDFTPFVLAEGEMRQIDITFPVEDKDTKNALKEVFFEFQLTDIFGNKYLSKGNFPIK
jgi:hypothetical protein